MNQKMNILKLSRNAVMPKRATDGSAGFDLSTIEGGWLPVGQTRAFKTGLAFEIPNGFEMVIRPRSGISLKTNLLVMIGTIDADYRGNVAIIVKNIGTKDYYVQRGTRLAQAVFHKVEFFDFVEANELSATDRGTGGFGHTGMAVKNEN